MSENGHLRSASEVKVIVVGAGASGLAAASRLKEAGVGSVVVLEASDRVGGRIHTDNFGDETVEMGAQWIHGQEGNAAYEIAQGEGVTSDPDLKSIESLRRDLYDVNGEKLGVDDVAYFYNLEEEDDMFGYPYKMSESVASYYDSFFAKHSLGQPALEVDKMNALKDVFHRQVQSYDGCDNWQDLSVKGCAHDFQWAQGNQYVSFKPGHGFSEVLDRFTRTVDNGSEIIRLNSEVAKIVVNGGGCGVKVVLASGEELTADSAIVTVSLAVLKAQSKEMFGSALSSQKVEAIEKMGIGSNAKVYLRYAAQWWPDEHDSFGVSYVFYDGETFAYSEAEAESDWTRFVRGMYRVTNHPNVLQAWVAGAGARKMETLTDDSIKADLHRLALKFLGKAYPELPEPIAIKVSRWSSNPFIRGSWSYQTVSSTASGVGPSDLAKPEMDGRLLFAGEATHDCYFSTVHGAIEAGWREADRIIGELNQ